MASLVINSSNHLKWMREALNVARRALDYKEVPVGCVIVYDVIECKNESLIIGQGHNLTNVTKNPTRHAEFEAIGNYVLFYFMHRSINMHIYKTTFLLCKSRKHIIVI